jgi:hypothetical protein
MTPHILECGFEKKCIEMGFKKYTRKKVNANNYAKFEFFGFPLFPYFFT